MIIVPGRDRRADCRRPRFDELSGIDVRPEPVDGPRLLVARPRPRAGALAHPGGRRRRWQRSTMSSATARTSTGCPTGRADQARQRQHRRAGPGPVRPRPGAGRRAGRRRLRRRRRGVRHGLGRVRGGRGPRVRATSGSSVLPGLTAAQAVAARAGAPLGGDYAVLSLSDRLKPWAVIEQRLRAVAGGRPGAGASTTPPRGPGPTRSSRPRRSCWSTARRQTPVVVGRDVGRAGESLIVTTLGDLDPDTIDMSCLLIVGSSRDRRSALRRLDAAGAPRARSPTGVEQHRPGGQLAELLGCARRRGATRRSPRPRSASPTMITAA